MNRVPHPTARLVAPLMALVLLVPLALPVVAHAGAGHEGMSDTRNMDMSGDMPCPPRGEEISSCCMQTGLVTATPAVPHRQQGITAPSARGLDSSVHPAAHIQSFCVPTGREPQDSQRAARCTPLHILNASFLL